MANEKEMICNSEICDFRFDNLEKRLDKQELDSEQRREEVQAIKEAMITITGAYERTTSDVKDIKNILNKSNSNDKLFELLKMVIVALIAIAGAMAGVNIPQ